MDVPHHESVPFLITSPEIKSSHHISLRVQGPIFTSIEYSLQNMFTTPKLVSIALFETAKIVTGNK